MSDTPYRLAMRREGAWLNTYWAREGTMEGAELVATCLIEMVENEPELLRAYQSFMALGSTVLVKTRLGLKAVGVEFNDAPEHERAGRG